MELQNKTLHKNSLRELWGLLSARHSDMSLDTNCSVGFSKVLNTLYDIYSNNEYINTIDLLKQVKEDMQEYLKYLCDNCTYQFTFDCALGIRTAIIHLESGLKMYEAIY